MRRVALVAFCACGGLEVVPNPDGGDAAVIHGQRCTQSACASAVTTVATISTQEGEQVQLPGIAIGGGFVYTSTPTHLVRAPENGGPVETVAPSSLTYAIVADDENVYWSTGNPPGVFMRAHAGGETVALPAAQPSIATNLFLDATNVYWNEGDAFASVPIAGGARTVYPTMTRDAALRGGRFFAASCASTMDVGSAPAAPINAGYYVSADDVACYWATGDSVFMKPFGGGAPVELFAGPSTESSINGMRMVADGDAVYVSSLNGSDFGPLSRVPRGGGSLEHVTEDVIVAYAITGDSIYWMTVDTSVLIKRMPKWH